MPNVSGVTMPNVSGVTFDPKTSLDISGHYLNIFLREISVWMYPKR